MLKTADFKTCARIQPKRGWCFVRKLFLCVFLCLFPIFSFSATLPSGYTELEYIESNGTQYIDSGIYPDKNTEIEMVVKTKEAGYPQYLFGVSGDDGKRYMLAQEVSDGSLIFDFASASNRLHSSITAYTDFHKIEIKNQSFIVDETTVGSFASTNNFSQTNTAYVFDAHGSTWGSDTGSKIKYLKIWQSGTLVRDYIPAEHNGQIGMYDAVSGNFFTNAETHYTQLEYLKSSGTQYIEDTNFQTINTGAIEIKTKELTPHSRFAGWGNGNNYLQVSVSLATPNSETNFFPFCYNNSWNDVNNRQTDITAENVVRYEFAPGLQKLYVNGVLDRQGTTTGSVSAYPFRLFKVSLDTSVLNGYGKIYYCKVFNENDALRRHYIPVRRDSDGAIGMYEIASRAFLTNAGTGSFTVGPDTNLFVNEFTAGPVVETYTELEYIDIPASTCFNTNVYLNGSMDIEYEVMIAQISSLGQFGHAKSEAVVGAGFNFPYNYNHPTNGTNILVDYFGSSSNYDRWFIQTNGSNYAPEENKKYKVSIVNKLGSFSVDETVIDTHTFVGSGIPNTVPYFIHGSYSVDALRNDFEDTMRFYHFSATGVADIVPVKRNSDNALGLYNKITGEFLEKIGSGTLVAGPELSQTIAIHWGGLAEPDASGMCVYGETFTAPSTAPTAPSGLKFLGWIPR